MSNEMKKKPRLTPTEKFKARVAERKQRLDEQEQAGASFVRKESFHAVKSNLANPEKEIVQPDKEPETWEDIRAFEKSIAMDLLGYGTEIEKIMSNEGIMESAGPVKKDLIAALNQTALDIARFDRDLVAVMKPTEGKIGRVKGLDDFSLYSRVGMQLSNLANRFSLIIAPVWVKVQECLGDIAISLEEAEEKADGGLNE